VIVASVALLAVAGGWRLAAYPVVPARVAVTTTMLPVPTAPPDGLRLPHLFLTPQHGASATACQEMADRLNFAVPCPDLLPVDATISGPDCCIFSNPNVAPLFVLEFHFRAPTGYPPSELSRDGIPRGHLVIIGQHLTATSSALACSATTPAGDGPPVGGAPSHWETCGGSGSNAGHLILEWEAAGIDYSISLHGETPENRAAIVLMAEQLTLVAPGN